MLGKSSLLCVGGGKYEKEKCKLMWNGQRVVFKGTFVICLDHSTSEPPSLVWVLPYLRSLVVGTTYLFLEMLKMPIFFLLFLSYIPFGSLAAEVQAHNLSSRDSCLRVTGKVHSQGHLPDRAGAAERLCCWDSIGAASVAQPHIPACVHLFFLSSPQFI